MINKILITILISLLLISICGCVETGKNSIIGIWENTGSNAVIIFENDGRYIMDYNPMDNEVVKLKYVSNSPSS